LGRKYGLPAPRSIYPETIRSEQIRELAKNKDHLLVWYGLFHGVDDQGRMEARISKIQSDCLGHLPEDAIPPDVIKDALQRMRRLKDKDGKPLIYIYSAQGTKVLQIAGWWEHQGYMKNAWPSRWEPMPGWLDEIRGHGKRALTGSPNGNNGGTDGGTDRGSYLSVSVSPSSSSEDAPKPWDLFEAFLDERGLTVQDFPGHRIQLNHAKKMLGEGFTVDEVRQACRAFASDQFWSKRPWDLATIRAHWGKLKAQSTTKPRARPVRTLADIPDR
jgi:hypothetical protein